MDAKELIAFLRQHADWHEEGFGAQVPEIVAHVKKLREWADQLAAIPSDAAQAPQAAAYLVTGVNDCNEDWASAWIKRGNADEAAARLYRAAVTPLYAAPVAPAAAPVEWQPIETAPKTGRTLLLGYVNSAGKWRTVRGQWMSEAYIAEYWEDPDDVEPGWFETSAEADDVPNCWGIEPTHWMPLPTAPQGAAQ